MSASASTSEVLDAITRFLTANARMHQRVRATTSLGENEVRILGFLLERHREGQPVRPSEISRHLDISSASTTALLDRLERHGSVERVTHPTDRRSILIAPTESAASEFADIVGSHDDRLAALVDGLDEDDRVVVRDFLNGASAVADDVASTRRDAYASM